MILVFLAMFGVMFLITQYFQLILGFSPLGRRAALPADGADHVDRRPAHAPDRGPHRCQPNRRDRDGPRVDRISLVHPAGVDTSYSYVLVFVLLLISGIALTMSPMTASIMSAVPSRRAGAGSAMNDATGELGAALGVAVLGSVAAFAIQRGDRDAIAPLSPGDQATASASLGAALQTAARLPQDLAGPLVSAAEQAFVNGIHIAAFTGSVLCAGAALAVLKFMPRQIEQHGAMHDAVSSAEDMAELGIGGALPVFADTVGAEDVASELAGG